MKQELMTSYTIKNDIRAMKQYLEDVYSLEKNIYISRNAITQINNTISKLGVKEYIKRDYFDLADVLSSTISIGFFGCIPMFFISLICGLSVAFSLVSFPITFIILVYSEMSKVKQTNSDAEIAEKNQEFRIKEENDKKNSYYELRKSYEEVLANCNQKLNALYDMNIIFSKYRNFVAVSQIYEYYMSGRCIQLEGHEGAYNIFENELRQNIIILKLNEVLNQLEEIKQNQYMIYQAINEANARLANIESNTAAIAYNTSVIAGNTAIYSRYY